MADHQRCPRPSIRCGGRALTTGTMHTRWPRQRSSWWLTAHPACVASGRPRTRAYDSAGVPHVLEYSEAQLPVEPAGRPSPGRP